MFNLEFKSWMDSNAGVRVGCSFIFSWFGVTLGHLFTSAPWCKTFLTLIFAMHYIYKKNQILNDLQKNASHQMHEIFHSKIRFISGTRKPLWFSPSWQVKQSKGQIISECPYEIIVYPKIATKKFPRYLPWPLRRGQTKNFIKPIMLNNP